MWNVTQVGYAVFGTGTTKEAAKLDALQWLDDPDGVQGGGTMEWLESEIRPISAAVDGDLVLIYERDKATSDG